MKQRLSIFQSLSSAFFICLALLFFSSPAYAAKKNYKGEQRDGLGILATVILNVKTGEIVDRISGKIIVSTSGVQAEFPLSGFYESLTGNLVLFYTIKGKKKVITGRYDEKGDFFFLNIRLKKGQILDVVCPRKGKEIGLTGTWLINDTSFIKVTLSETSDGVITGSVVTKSFEDYRLEGDHESDSLITIKLISPNGDDDTTYTLSLCESKETMKGTNDDIFSGDAIWCRSSRGVSGGECAEDPTCGK